MSGTPLHRFARALILCGCLSTTIIVGTSTGAPSDPPTTTGAATTSAVLEELLGKGDVLEIRYAWSDWAEPSVIATHVIGESGSIYLPVREGVLIEAAGMSVRDLTTRIRTLYGDNRGPDDRLFIWRRPHDTAGPTVDPERDRVMSELQSEQRTMKEIAAAIERESKVDNRAVTNAKLRDLEDRSAECAARIRTRREALREANTYICSADRSKGVTFSIPADQPMSTREAIARAGIFQRLGTDGVVNHWSRDPATGRYSVHHYELQALGAPDEPGIAVRDGDAIWVLSGTEYRQRREALAKQAAKCDGNDRVLSQLVPLEADWQGWPMPEKPVDMISEIFVSGELNTTGTFAWPQRRTKLLTVIQLAGYEAPRAKWLRVKVRRRDANGDVTMPIDHTISELIDDAERLNIDLQPFDSIHVLREE
jgi:protein involved in polysaccharide export with SLBB domain